MSSRRLDIKIFLNFSKITFLKHIFQFFNAYKSIKDGKIFLKSFLMHNFLELIKSKILVLYIKKLFLVGKLLLYTNNVLKLMSLLKNRIFYLKIL